MERDRYEKKHDEMFAAISGLNSRIEELEQHKLHLLQRLKKYGDKGDLGYIIKT
jgi:prefoldin subunit 5